MDEFKKLSDFLETQLEKLNTIKTERVYKLCPSGHGEMKKSSSGTWWCLQCQKYYHDMKKYPELNDCCNVLYDGRECVAMVTSVDLDSDTFDVITSFGSEMWNIAFEKFRYNSEETAIIKYDTIEKIVLQLESCNYESEGGLLINNVAFVSLKRMSFSAEGKKFNKNLIR